MCDRRLNGEPLPEDIKFIAACNPYRKYVISSHVAIQGVLCVLLYNRHSKEMIQRLENAGLGFYVKSTKTIHKLGNHVLLYTSTANYIITL